MNSGLYTFFTICVRFIAPLVMAFILYGQVSEFIKIPIP